MFVKIVQKWNAFKQDWAEYQRLRRVAGRVWKKLESMKAKITVMYRETESRPEKCCIAKEILDCQQLATVNDLFSCNTPMIMMVEKYCPHFRGKEKPVQACNEKTCPYYAENCEYIAAAQEYEAAVAQKRTFWGRVKNKTK